MDWTSLLGSLSGGALGFIGAGLTKILGIYEARQAHKMKLEELELSSKIDLQKADLFLRQTREDQAGQAFTSAIQAEGGLRPASNWVSDTMKLWRPALTLILVMTGVALTLWGGVETATREYALLTLFGLAGQAVGFWFGVRTFEKPMEVRAAYPAKARP